MRAVRGRHTSKRSAWDVMVRLYNQESAALEADWHGGTRQRSKMSPLAPGLNAPEEAEPLPASMRRS